MNDALLASVRRHADAHSDESGVARTPIPGLVTIRATRPGELQYAISRPLVALVVQGRKRVTMGARSFDFGAGDSLVIAADVPTPAEQITARRALQLQLLTRRHEPAPQETWGADVARVLATPYDAANARRLQNALKALLRR